MPIEWSEAKAYTTAKVLSVLDRTDQRMRHLVFEKLSPAPMSQSASS